MAERKVKIEPTFLENIPILNILERIRIAVLNWIYKAGDIEKIQADNVIKKAIVMPFAFIFGTAIVANVINWLFGMFLPAWLASMIGFFMGSLGYIYFLEPRLGKVTSPIGEVAISTAVASAITFPIVLGLFQQYIPGVESAIVTSLGLEGKGFFEQIAPLIFAEKLTAKSVLGAGAVTIPALGYFMTYSVLMFYYGTGAMLSWLFAELRRLRGA